MCSFVVSFSWLVVVVGSGEGGGPEATPDGAPGYEAAVTLQSTMPQTSTLRHSCSVGVQDRGRQQGLHVVMTTRGGRNSDRKRVSSSMVNVLICGLLQLVGCCRWFR